MRYSNKGCYPYLKRFLLITKATDLRLFFFWKICLDPFFVVVVEIV